MNSKEIEQENYIKVIVQLRKEMRKNKKPDSQVKSDSSDSSLLYNIKNQQQLEDQQQISDNIQINQLNQQRQGQNNSIVTNTSKLFYYDQLEQAEKYLKLVYKNIYNVPPEQLDKRLQEYEVIPCSLIKKISKTLICKGLSFNQDNTLLATTQEKYIQIFNFNNGYIEQIVEFEAHESNVNSLVFSKKGNYLLSGGDDNYIFMWMESNIQNRWVNRISINTKSPISYMTLNKMENFLIVGNKYGFIQIWILNIPKESIKIGHELRQVHTKQICGISLNSSEDRLITCSLDKNIILWRLDEKGILEKIVEKQRVNIVSRILFLQDNKILLAENRKGLIELKLEKDKFKEGEKLIIEDQSEDCPNFIIQYNLAKKIIVIKYNRFIYMFRENIDFYELQKKLEFDSNKIYGTLSSNSKYLATVNEDYLYVYDVFE